MGHDELRGGGEPSDRYAEYGFPMRESTARAIENQLPLFERWPGNKTYWFKPDGSRYRPGETIKLPATAKTLRRMVEAERAAKASGRVAGIDAARIVSTRATSRGR